MKVQKSNHFDFHYTHKPILLLSGADSEGLICYIGSITKNLMLICVVEFDKTINLPQVAWNFAGTAICYGDYFGACPKTKKSRSFNLDFLLPDLDSNQDKLNQNQLYYHYTIGQFQLITCGSSLKGVQK